MLMGAVVGCGAIIMGIMAWMQKEVLTDPGCIPAQKKGKKTKTKLSFGECRGIYLCRRVCVGT
jgi:ATP/ADP translocase